MKVFDVLMTNESPEMSVETEIILISKLVICQNKCAHVLLYDVPVFNLSWSSFIYSNGPDMMCKM